MIFIGKTADRNNNSTWQQAKPSRVYTVHYIEAVFGDEQEHNAAKQEMIEKLYRIFSPYFDKK